MRDSPERTVRPVSEHFYTKGPEDAAYYMTKNEKSEAVVDENVGSDAERTSDAPAVYDRKPKYYEPANDAERTMDKKLNFKLDFIVIVICAINFVLQGIDKTNIGNAASTETFEKDAHLGKNDVSDSVSLLAVTFVTIQPFATVLGRRIGPKYFIPALMVSWGAVCMAHAGINNSGTLLALRLLLGAFEAGFVPTCFYYLGTLYPHYMLGFRLGLFAGMFSIAAAFSGLIAYGIFHIHSSRYKDWQLLFLIEGGVTILMAIVTLFVLPDKLSTAWFLSEAERKHAVHRMQVDNPQVDRDGNHIEDNHKVTWQNLRDAIIDWRKLLIICCNIFSVLPVSVFSVFMPLIVKGMGYSGVKSNLMSVSPFVVGAFGVFTFMYLSDHFHERSLIVACSMLLSLVGFVVLIVSKNAKLRYGFVHICLAGAGTGGPVVVAWLTDNTPDKAKRSLIIGINGYSNIAGVIAGQLFKKKYAPSYKRPLTITMILISLGCCGYIVMRVVLMYENRRRAKIIAHWTDEQYEEERRTTERRGDRKLTFVYGY